MRSSLISILLAIVTFSSTSSWANEISKTEYFTSIKSLPICRFVHNLFEDWNDCTGLYDYGNGYKYFGDWVHNRPEGWGIRIDEEFSYFYIGQFLNGEENGYGLSGYLSENGSFYLGTYEQGNREGWFTIFSSDGTTSVGQFVNDERHGIWLKTNAEGKEYLYEYKRGEQVFPPIIYKAPERMDH